MLYSAIAVEVYEIKQEMPSAITLSHWLELMALNSVFPLPLKACMPETLSFISVVFPKPA